jgi:RNA polymerase sigma-32 factor
MASGIVEAIFEGVPGLMQVMNCFGPDRGFRLTAYTTWWICAAIQAYILHSWSPVKTGHDAVQKKPFLNPRPLKAQLHSQRT